MYEVIAVQDSAPLRVGSLASRLSEIFLVECLAGGIVVRFFDRSLDALSSVEAALDRTAH
ncbi:hypothetical protein [Brachybacterium epidermidis]|uniref:hypothetical protein n=1 Tax=Brachybacterium epidermidis TaxID=2781983 RepID=UPI00398E9896